MSAKEIFKKLGYEQNIDGFDLSYHKLFGVFESVIVFDLKYQRISFIHFDDPDAISLDEFNAIRKQVDELGWFKKYE